MTVFLRGLLMPESDNTQKQPTKRIGQKLIFQLSDAGRFSTVSRCDCVNPLAFVKRKPRTRRTTDFMSFSAQTEKKFRPKNFFSNITKTPSYSLFFLVFPIVKHLDPNCAILETFFFTPYFEFFGLFRSATIFQKFFGTNFLRCLASKKFFPSIFKPRT